MSNAISVPTPDNFNFRHAVGGHGWYELAPFVFDESSESLSYVYKSGISGCAEPITITSGPTGLKVKLHSKTTDKKEAERVARHVLRLDEDLSDFYSSVGKHEHFSWVAEMNAGRLLRSGTVFEDLVKTMCTTNCSWALTKIMTTNLVEKLGDEGVDGRKAFPSPKTVAAQSEAFLREEIRSGYRSPYLIELAEAVAGGKIDPESWLTSGLSSDELKIELKKVKGIGEYAADNLLKLLGRYEGLALDSALRAGFYKKHNREKPCPDKKIERHYKQFGKWKGLAIWCDMTKHWFEQGR